MSSLEETRAFFAPRAATWDERFPDDAPAFARAVKELDLSIGSCVLDVGCGTGRAFEVLRAGVGPTGHVVGLDVTPEMLHVAARHTAAPLVLAHARYLCFGAATVDGVFAAGLLPHLPDPVDGLAELARVVRPRGRLALFHPIGRAALAARHERSLRPDDALDPRVLPGLLRATGWEPLFVDDAADRYLAVAQRAR